MIYKVYSIFDNAIKAYMPPVCYRSKGEMLREISNVINSQNGNGISLHPADYFIFEIGEYDDSNASFTLYDAPDKVGCAIEFKNSDA